MRIDRSLSDWPQAAHGAVIALGNFDGVHQGHRAVIAKARAIAEAHGRPLAVMTFEPHPRRFFKPSLPVLRIVPFAEKARLLRAEGVDFLYVARFNAAFSQLTAEEFIRSILLEGLRVGHVVTGHNFSFGHKRGGDVAYMQSAASQHGFDYTQVEAQESEGRAFSSTAIRHALEHGDVADVAELLGRAYTIRGRIIHGDKRGRSIGFPTANIRPDPLYLPQFGVYAVRLHIGGTVHDAVANLGCRPTVDGERTLLEVHALDVQEDFYGRMAQVEFIKFIRPEQKFSGIEGLKAQIAQDVMAARAILTEQQKVQA